MLKNYTNKDLEMIVQKSRNAKTSDDIYLANLAIDELNRREKCDTYLKYVYYTHNRSLYKDYDPKNNKDLFWIPGKHCIYICEHIDLFLKDKLVCQDDNIAKILILSLPPQHSKSTTVTETLPSYFLGNNHSGKVIECSYGQSLAKKFGRANKKKLEEFGEDLFGIDFVYGTDQEFEIRSPNRPSGVMISRGILSGITGNPGQLVIIDDPIKNRAEADSESMRDKIWNEYLNSLKTRLSADGKIIVIQTRWHRLLCH